MLSRSLGLKRSRFRLDENTAFSHERSQSDAGSQTAARRITVHIIEVALSRKRAKALIMDALARAQAADRAKSFFIASISHEIRTPLNSVIGFAELEISPSCRIKFLLPVRLSARQASRYHTRPYTARKRAGRKNVLNADSPQAAGY